MDDAVWVHQLFDRRLDARAVISANDIVMPDAARAASATHRDELSGFVMTLTHSPVLFTISFANQQLIAPNLTSEIPTEYLTTRKA